MDDLLQITAGIPSQNGAEGFRVPDIPDASQHDHRGLRKVPRSTFTGGPLLNHFLRKSSTFLRKAIIIFFTIFQQFSTYNRI